MRAALNRWGALPPGAARDRLTRHLIASLRALSPDDTRRLTADIYHAFRLQTHQDGSSAPETADEARP